MSLQIAVVIAAYNEATVIEKTCRDILNAPPSNLHLVIVDDGSTDDTFKKATNLPRATALRHSINMGQGAALQTGIEYAVRNNFLCHYF